MAISRWHVVSRGAVFFHSGGEDDTCHGKGFFVACGLWDGGGFVTF